MMGAISYSFVAVQPNAVQLAQIASIYDSAGVLPAIDSKFDLEHIRDANARSEAGHVHGKIAVCVTQEPEDAPPVRIEPLFERALAPEEINVSLRPHRFKGGL